MMNPFDTGPNTRNRILDSAQELIQRVGVNGMSFQDISAVVGIRKASIHHHFPTKEALVEALLERYSAWFLDLVDDISASTESAKTRLTRYADLFETTLCEGNGDKACLCAMLGAELSALGYVSVERVRRFFSDNEARLARLLEEGRKAGEFSFEGDALDHAKTIFAVLEGGLLIARATTGADHFRAIRRSLFALLGA